MFNPTTTFFTCPAQGGSGIDLVTKGDNATCQQLKAVQQRNEEMFRYYFSTPQDVTISSDVSAFKLSNADILATAQNPVAITSRLDSLITATGTPQDIAQPIVDSVLGFRIFIEGVMVFVVIWVMYKAFVRLFNF